MFEIKIDDARYWKNCVDSIVSLVDEGSFVLSKEGITLKANYRVNAVLPVSCIIYLYLEHLIHHAPSSSTYNDL